MVEGKNPLLSTTNGDYGDPRKQEVQVPTYKEVADKAKSQKVGLAVLKHQILLEKKKQIAQTGKEDTMYYDMESGLKPSDQYRKVPDPFNPTGFTYEFPGSEKTQYPQQGLNKGDNPMYKTTSQEFGKLKPAVHDLPEKFYPKNNIFTGSFVGGQKIPDTRLNTALTPSRVHKEFDA